MNTILILHGWGSSSRNWTRIKELLEKEGVKVFLPDLPGFGENPPPSRPWSVDDYVNWVKEYIDNLSQTCGELVEPFFLLGHSFGGGIAARFVNYFPERVQRLILVAPAIRRQRGLRHYIALVLAKMGNLIFSLVLLSAFKKLARKFLYTILGTQDYLKLELEKAVIMKETFKKIVSEDLLFCLPQVKVPTLIVWGRKDGITPLKDGLLIKKNILNSKLEIIEDGRHCLSIEKPEILAENILNFIKTQSL